MAVGEGTMLRMETPEGSSTLLAVSMRGEESISTPFLFVIDAVADDADLAPDDFLFKPVSLTIQRVDGQERYIHGFVRRFTRGDHHAGAYHYILEVVPKLWFLSQSSDDRIYHKKKTKEIISGILGDNGITDIKWKVQNEGPEHDFIVQYNETYLDFISRLMEEAGFFYFFQFADGVHTLMIGDNNGAFEPVAEPLMSIQAGASTVDALDHWRTTDATAIGKVMVRDYDMLKPAAPVEGSTNTVAKTGGAKDRAVVAWPALTAEHSVAADRAKLRQEAAEAWSNVSSASGFNQHFAAGAKFVVIPGDWASVTAGDYVIRSVSHFAHDEAQAAGGGGAGYHNSFTAFPARTNWRQPLATPRPKMGGIWTAIVIGPNGEEIHTDEHGRIKVRLFWDHGDGEHGATSDNTIWVRVMQPWSGNKWGWQHIPRIGSEVAVAFVDGDPDHPIVVGSLYNAQQMYPFPLPDEKNKTGIKTRSTKGGSSGMYNEFSFDDTEDKEVIHLHAQKDHTIEVQHDQMIKVHNDQMVDILNDQTIHVLGFRSRKIEKDETVDVLGKQTLTITKDRSATIKEGNESIEVSKGNSKLEVAMGNWENIVKMGNVTVKASLGKIELEAMQSIKLTVGESSIELTQQGISIAGLQMKIDGQIQTEVHGLMLSLKGDAMGKLSAPMIMIGP